ncbi:hypothetical protein [Candidatus Nitrosacidococcus sp. I8]|uniref:hypothetical protein n=1 Tax=Candidatus Nitrosacidococcus sp. I8 TaxID=2942908 RepID=UPI00222606F1|nr:hypothetical protein [Candidatus Nitrosacidococcus sp. I8]CAH9017979.1 hypothetical protein NURINAE_00660 [Candidatus Nitrosacidococcus sp. I8]
MKKLFFIPILFIHIQAKAWVDNLANDSLEGYPIYSIGVISEDGDEELIFDCSKNGVESTLLLNEKITVIYTSYLAYDAYAGFYDGKKPELYRDIVYKIDNNRVERSGSNIVRHDIGLLKLRGTMDRYSPWDILRQMKDKSEITMQVEGLTMDFDISGVSEYYPKFKEYCNF